jgi:hypothetical protein
VVKTVDLTERFSSKSSPASQSEKAYDFPALFICVRDQRVDEFWDEGWMAFVTTTGTRRSAGRGPFLNRSFSECLMR